MSMAPEGDHVNRLKELETENNRLRRPDSDDAITLGQGSQARLARRVAFVAVAIPRRTCPIAQPPRMKGTLIHHQSPGTKQLANVESGAHLAQGDNFCKLIELGSGG
jgi:hypothetical protein